VCAALNGHEGVVKLLLQREDVDPNRTDKHGGTPFSYATKKGHERIVQLLQARKSVGPPDVETPSVETPGAGARRERRRDVWKRRLFFF